MARKTLCALLAPLLWLRLWETKLRPNSSEVPFIRPCTSFFSRKARLRRWRRAGAKGMEKRQLSLALRATTKRPCREIAHCAIEATRTPSGQMPAASSVATRAASPFGFSRQRRHECAPSVRHESRSPVHRFTKRLSPLPRCFMSRNSVPPCLRGSVCNYDDSVVFQPPRKPTSFADSTFERNREAFSCFDARLDRLSWSAPQLPNCPRAFAPSLCPLCG